MILGLRRALLLLACFVAPLDAQRSEPRTTYSAVSHLFQSAANYPLYCSAIPVDQGQLRMGVARLYEFQLPQSGQRGQVGIARDGTVRYLAVLIERAVNAHTQRDVATLHFRANGSVEVGRQSWELVRADSGVVEQRVGGVAAHDVGPALQLARSLAARCPTR